MAGAEVLELVSSWLVVTTLTFVVVIVDERRMTSADLELAWLPTTRNAAIALLGILALPVHFALTRGRRHGGRVRGYGLGLMMGSLSLVAVLLVSEVILRIVFWIIGMPIVFDG